METTKNYALNKPAQDDFYNVDNFNENADIIDEELHALENLVYEDAKTLETLKNGEKIGTAFGKIKLAITNLINHLSDKIVHITADERNKWNAKQDSSTAITTGNIGNQSVKYAESSGSAKNADYATSAGTATNAVNAKSAEKATTAGSATSATFATTAGNADTVDGWHLSNIQSDAQSRADNAYNGAIDEINAKDRTVLHLSGGRMTGALCMQKNDISDTYAIYAISNDCMQLLANNSIRLLHKDWGSYTDAIVDNLHYQGGLYKDSYRGAKENILPIDEKRARKVLDIPVRIFDYRPGFGNGEKDVVGEIVDEVQDIIPEAVVMPEDWDESNFNELLGDMGNEQIPGIDQTKFIPYLIAMVQLQQKQIEDLEQKVTALENE